MKMRVIRTWVLAAAVVVPSCARQRSGPPWPGDTWPASAPEEQGMDSAALKARAATCWGYGGQFLFVVPEYDLVAVFNGWNIYGRPELEPKFALDRVLAAIRRGVIGRAGSP